MSDQTEKPKLYLRHTGSGKRFRIVKFDKEKNTVTLRGEVAEFTEIFDKSKFKALGYIMEQE